MRIEVTDLEGDSEGMSVEEEGRRGGGGGGKCHPATTSTVYEHVRE